MVSKQQLTEVIRSQNLAKLIQNIGEDVTYLGVKHYLDLGIIQTGTYKVTDEDIELILDDSRYLIIYDRFLQYEDIFTALLLKHVDTVNIDNFKYDLVSWYMGHVNQDSKDTVRYISNILTVVFLIFNQKEDKGVHPYNNYPKIAMVDIDTLIDKFEPGESKPNLMDEMDFSITKDIEFAIKELKRCHYKYKDEIDTLLRGYYNYMVYDN